MRHLMLPKKFMRDQVEAEWEDGEIAVVARRTCRSKPEALAALEIWPFNHVPVPMCVCPLDEHGVCRGTEV